MKLMEKVLGEWIELPLVSPQQIQISRIIKHTLSGNLQKKIDNTMPTFPGTEAHYLKAQIVRIAFSTQISPNGVYKLSEKGDNTIEIDNDFNFPGHEDLGSLDNWVHMNPNILKAGRAKHWVSSKLSEDQASEAMAKLEEKDPPVDRLRAIKEDKRKPVGVTVSAGINRSREQLAGEEVR